MALFGLFNYAKPGKGVAKDAPEKKRFFLFFELYFRKFWKLMLLNIMLAVITFPFVSAFIVWVMSAFSIDSGLFEGNMTMYIFSSVLFALPQPFGIILAAVSALMTGPSIAAATYIWRQFARQEHSWIWSDFWERFKSNFKQSFAVGILDILVLCSIVLYLSLDFTGNSTLTQYMLVFRYVAIIVFVIYAVMRFYIYLIMVTFDMSVIAILRNSWIFSVLGLFRNICTIFFSGLVLAVTFILPLPMMAFFTYSLIGFITTFNAYPLMEKFMLKPRVQNEDGSITIVENEAEDEGKESVFADDVRSAASSEEVKNSNYDEVMRNRQAYQNGEMLPSFDKKEEDKKEQ